MVEYKYDAWGDHNIILSEPSYENLAKANPFRYRGYYYDEGIGLYYLKSRYYDPEIGRFITIDDISYLDAETINGLNLYAYCRKNPVFYVDNNGRVPISIWESIIGFLKDLFVGFGAAALKKSAYLFSQLAYIPMFLLDDVGGVIFNPVYLSSMKLATGLQYKGKILNVLGNIAKSAGYILTAIDIGITIYNNFTNPKRVV